MNYYDLKGNWPKVKRHLTNPVVTDTLVTNSNEFTFGPWDKEFLPGMLSGYGYFA
jgi:hypothetical protein